MRRTSSNPAYLRPAGGSFDGPVFVPTLQEVATALAQVPRWNGATVVPWSVLQHTLAMHDVIEAADPDDVMFQLHVLGHDAEEMVTGDIRRPFKTAEQRELGDRLRATIYQHTFGVPAALAGDNDRLKVLDDLAAWAEAQILIRPDHRDIVELQAGEFDLNHMITAVWDLRDATPREQVYSWLERVETLLDTQQVQTARRRL